MSVLTSRKLPKGPYHPIKTEIEVLKFWKKGKFNKPEYNPKLNNGKGGVSTTSKMKADKRKPFCIIMPPPNANARPHLGNISGYSYQDLMGRYWRMKGRKVLLLPGKDHAGIQSEAVFEREVLNKKGLTKFDLGREEFYKQCYKFCIENSKMACRDEERVGISADFERNTFTLDPKIVRLVLDTFIKLYHDGLVYKGVRITNWCPKCLTALADSDTEKKERKATLFYINYPLVEEKQNIWRLNFASGETWKALIEERKKIDTRALNPEEPNRYLGDIKIGDIIVAVNKANHNETKLFIATRVRRYKKLEELFEKEDLSKIFPDDTPRTIDELERAYSKLTDGYLERIRKNGVVLIELKPYNFKSARYITIATTRPETMLADTAIAVNPNDKRYKKLVGQRAIVPLVNREVPIITDPNVDVEFGTGALKVTPAHAPEDYEIILRWNKANPNKKIDYINVIWKDSKLYGPVGNYKGMSIDAARGAVLHDLENLGLIDNTEEIEQNIIVCERCKNPIEPIMSSQWYIKVDSLKKKAIYAVKKGKIKIHPKYMERSYFRWMENLRDWPISRSLWWGYRFPVWYKGKKEESVDENGKIIEKVGNKLLDPTNKKQLKVQLKSPGRGWFQDEDVFDTWFSSGQWPFITLMKWRLLDTFYPTDVMETGFDILQSWVSRMIMLGLYRTKKIPFRDVYLHGMLRAPDGTKMSKSRGNVINMDDVVKSNGADTLRLFFLVAGKAGAWYNFDWNRIKFNRNFLNKVWNAARFVLSNTQSETERKSLNLKTKRGKEKFILTEDDRKIVAHVDALAKSVSKNIENFRFSLAIEEIINSFWHEFCDKYIESTKSRIYFSSNELMGKHHKTGIGKEDNVKLNKKEIRRKVYERVGAQITLKNIFKNYLKLLHPFVPFITEALWQYFREKNEPLTIMYAKWPCAS